MKILEDYPGISPEGAISVGIFPLSFFNNPKAIEPRCEKTAGRLNFI